MQFVNNNTPTSKKIFPMTSINYTNFSNRASQINGQKIEPRKQIVNTSTTPSQKSKWGAPTWFFFHTLAHKLKDEYVEILLPELFNIIVLICSNLPCPTCTKHATDYMNKIIPNLIKTKTDMKNMLYLFHNEVNKLKGYPNFDYDELDTKYNTANTKNIAYNFFYFYRQKDFNINMITNNMHREQAAKSVQAWLMKNINAFEP